MVPAWYEGPMELDCSCNVVSQYLELSSHAAPLSFFCCWPTIHKLDISRVLATLLRARTDLQGLVAQAMLAGGPSSQTAREIACVLTHIYEP